MQELSDKKLKEICESIHNGQKKQAREWIRELNALQVANFIMRASNYALPRHSAYVQVQIALGE